MRNEFGGNWQSVFELAWQIEAEAWLHLLQQQFPDRDVNVMSCD